MALRSNWKRPMDKAIKDGTYIWKSRESGIFGGYVRVMMRETASSFILTLIENACKFSAPQLDDLFSRGERVVISKDGSKHALSFCKRIKDWFCLYPYRAGVPYSFDLEEVQ